MESVSDSTTHQESRTPTAALHQAAVPGLRAHIHHPNDGRTSLVIDRWTRIQHAIARVVVSQNELESTTKIYMDLMKQFPLHYP